MAQHDTPPRRRRRIPFLVYGIFALVLSLVLFSSFTFPKQAGTTTTLLPPIPTVTPLNSTPLPTIGAIPTVTPFPSPTPGPTPTSGGMSGGGPGVTLSPLDGPVGTKVSVTAIHMRAGDLIGLGVSASGCVADVQVLPAAEATVQTDGTLILRFNWPVTPPGTYIICVIDRTADVIFPADVHFQATSGAPATIMLANSVKSEQPVTVRGTRFPAGGTVEVLYGPPSSNGCANSQGTASVGDDGFFTFTFSAPYAAHAQIVMVTAVEPQGSCGNAPVVEARTYLRIVGTSPAAGAPNGTDAGNPFNLPTPFLQVLFLFTTLSGLVSLTQFAWGVFTKTTRRIRVPRIKGP
jgi:hypothetical protein